MNDQASVLFVSYSRADGTEVLRLAERLRAAGASLWIDRLDIAAGDAWDEAVARALQSCAGVLAMLSPESVASKSFMDEVSYALEENKRVIPVVLRQCDVPFRLRRLQRVDLSLDRETGYSDLLRALHLAEGSREGGKARSAAPAAGAASARPHAVAKDRILDYLKRKGFEMVSFDGIRKYVDPQYDDDFLHEVVRRHHQELRLANLAGDKPGIAGQ